ncbi:thioesterase II family protein [Flavobacteriaceae bacterium M23B6Z8]
MKLICIPYAGGTKQAYWGLKSLIGEQIEMITLELSGRGRRSQEPLIDNLDRMAEDLYDQIINLDLQEYVLFGHSMGAMLGDLVLHKLHENKRVLPFLFMVTGCPSPFRRGLRIKLSLLNDEELKNTLKKLGGLPEAAFESKAIIDYILPIIRNDMTAIDSWSYVEREKYEIPIAVFAGTQEGLKDEDLVTWQLETTGAVTFQYLAGGHFFINQHLEYLKTFISEAWSKNRKTFAASLR